MPLGKTPREYFNSIPGDFWACVLIVGATLTVYWQVHTHEFINFDDPIYITENNYVKQGLTADGFHWAFSLDDKQQTYWHPLTWLSHMLDVRIHGLAAGRHLLTNAVVSASVRSIDANSCFVFCQ